jgi:ABC-type phosphate transport system substrate-binding protein
MQTIFRRRPLIAATLLAMTLACSSAHAQAQAQAQSDPVVVIVHKDNPYQVARDYVADIYTGRVKGWPDGSPVFTLDQGDADTARAEFYRWLLGRTVANMQALWAQNIFAGRGLPPKQATPGAEMKRIIAANRHAIGYIRASELDDSVKALWR